MSQVSPVNYWWQHGHFSSTEAARGAFFLAYQQGMDGMGKTISEWMGITESEYNAWRGTGALPPLTKRVREIYEMRDRELLRGSLTPGGGDDEAPAGDDGDDG